MPWSCSEKVNPELWPQKSEVKVSQEKPRKATSTMKQMIGTIFAMVTTTFISAACFTPRVSAAKMSQVRADTAPASTHWCWNTGR